MTRRDPAPPSVPALGAPPPGYREHVTDEAAYLSDILDVLRDIRDLLTEQRDAPQGRPSLYRHPGRDH